MVGKLDDLKFHPDCNDLHCSICQQANSVLDDILYSSLSNRHDWLGKYHSWLKKQGISPETDGGWWSREALNDANVERFIDVYRDDEA